MFKFFISLKKEHQVCFGLFLRGEQSPFCDRDQINANSTFEKEYRVTPLLANNKEKLGLSLDGKLKDEDTNLASSTM